jgi:hypothetical protein
MANTAEPRRHPADVTNARLLTHYERYYERLSGAELVAVSTVRNALARIAGIDKGEIDPDES